MTMTPLQVDFCYHVAQGNSKQAEILPQKMHDENSPALPFHRATLPLLFFVYGLQNNPIFS